MKKYSKETLVGIFVIIGLLCIAYMTVKLGNVGFLGENTYSLYAKFSSVTGLRVGNPVNMLGLEIGRVASFKMDQENQVAVVKLDIENAVQLDRLKVEIEGINYQDVYLHGGRQTLVGNMLTVNMESISDLPANFNTNDLDILKKIFLQPSPFIQSDHKKIKMLAKEIVGNNDDFALNKAKKLMDWVHRNIRKRPVLSLPDALSTLENREGDCNEHAVLMAALTRAAGIPARVEAGLVYLKGRFYYHAWNLLYLGRWITADALFGQMPSDVTHIRFTTGAQQQLDLMGIIGRVKLKVIESEPIG